MSTDRSRVCLSRLLSITMDNHPCNYGWFFEMLCVMIIDDIDRVKIIDGKNGDKETNIEVDNLKEAGKRAISYHNILENENKTELEEFKNSIINFFGLVRNSRNETAPYNSKGIDKPEIYSIFRGVFEKNENAWKKYFIFDKNCDQPRKTDPNKIRLWLHNENSLTGEDAQYKAYGELGAYLYYLESKDEKKKEYYNDRKDTLEVILNDIKSVVEEYGEILKKKGTEAKRFFEMYSKFLAFFADETNEIQDTDIDIKQDKQILEQIYYKRIPNGIDIETLGETAYQDEIKRAMLFTECLVFCLLFGGPDAKKGKRLTTEKKTKSKDNKTKVVPEDNRQQGNSYESNGTYIEWLLKGKPQKFQLAYKIRYGKEDVLFEFDEVGKKKRETFTPGKYILIGKGGAGKSFALKDISENYPRCFYKDLKEYDINKTSKTTNKGSKKYNQLNAQDCDIILLDAINEVIKDYDKDSEVLKHILDDINDITENTDKTILIATRENDWGNEKENDQEKEREHIPDFLNALDASFTLCRLEVKIPEEDIKKYTKKLHLEKNFGETWLRLPLFYNIAKENIESGNGSEIGTKKIDTRFRFLCMYMKRVLKPYRTIANRLFYNLYVLPRVAYDNAFQRDIDIPQEFFDREVSNGVYIASFTEDTEGCMCGINDYARMYIKKAAEIIGLDGIMLCEEKDETFMVRGEKSSRFIDSEFIEHGKRRRSFRHQSIMNYLATLDYVVRFEIMKEKVLESSSSRSEYNWFMKPLRESSLLVNSGSYDIDWFIIEYFTKDTYSFDGDKFSKEKYEEYQKRKDNSMEDAFSDYYNKVIGKDFLDYYKRKSYKDYKLLDYLIVLEFVVELALVFQTKKIIYEKIRQNELVHKFCVAALNALKKNEFQLITRIEQMEIAHENDPDHNPDPRGRVYTNFIDMLSRFLEKDMQYYRLGETRWYEFDSHYSDYDMVYDFLTQKNRSPIIIHQKLKYDITKYEKEYKKLEDTIQKGNKPSPEEYVKLMSKIEELKRNLKNNFCGHSYSVLTLIQAYPNISLLNLGSKRDVKKAFCDLAKVIRGSDENGDLLRYTYVYAYRLLLFDITLKTYDPDRDMTLKDIGIRDSCINKKESATIAYLEMIQNRSTGYKDYILETMRLCVEFLLEKTDIHDAEAKLSKAEKEKADSETIRKLKDEVDNEKIKYLKRFVEMEKDDNQKEYLIFQVLKYSVLKKLEIEEKDLPGKISTSEEKNHADIIKKMIQSNPFKAILTREITKLLQNKENKRVIFQNTNCIYNLIFCLKLSCALNGKGDKWKTIEHKDNKGRITNTYNYNDISVIYERWKGYPLDEKGNSGPELEKEINALKNHFMHKMKSRGKKGKKK